MKLLGLEALDVERMVQRLREADRFAREYVTWLMDDRPGPKPPPPEVDPGLSRSYVPDFAAETVLGRRS